MLDLKAFIKYRETRAEFDETKKQDRIGFPCFVINGGEQLFVGLTDDAKAALKDVRPIA